MIATEGTYELKAKDFRVKLGNNQYGLKKDLKIPYIDSQGANAGLYVRNPLTGELDDCGPKFEPEDVEEAVKYVMGNLAESYDRLLGKTYRQLKKQGLEILVKLDGIFEPVQV